MAKGIKTGGRKKGSKNVNRFIARELAESLGVDPLEILLLAAKGDWKALGYKDEKKQITSRAGAIVTVDTINLETRIHCAAQALEYLHPRRKPVDADGDSVDRIRLELTTEERREKIKRLNTIVGSISDDEKKSSGT